MGCNYVFQVLEQDLFVFFIVETFSEENWNLVFHLFWDFFLHYFLVKNIFRFRFCHSNGVTLSGITLFLT